jgi:hypothetical protein
MKVEFTIQEGRLCETLVVDFGEGMLVNAKQIEGVMESLRKSSRGAVQQGGQTATDRIKELEGKLLEADVARRNAVSELQDEASALHEALTIIATDLGSDEPGEAGPEEIISAIAKLTAQLSEKAEKLEWIDITERTPEDGGRALFSYPDGVVASCSWASARLRQPTHWMPLPDPAKAPSAEPPKLDISTDGTVGIGTPGMPPTAKLEIEGTGDISEKDGKLEMTGNLDVKVGDHSTDAQQYAVGTEPPPTEPPAQGLEVVKRCKTCGHEETCGPNATGIDSARFNRCQDGSEWTPKVDDVTRITFDDFVKHGLEQEGANIVDGVPWSFEFQGSKVTHESDDAYILDGEERFERGDILTISGGKLTLHPGAEEAARERPPVDPPEPGQTRVG